MREPLFSAYDPYDTDPADPDKLIYPNAQIRMTFPTGPILVVSFRVSTQEKVAHLAKKLRDFYPSSSNLGRIIVPIPVTPERRRMLAQEIAAALVTLEGGNAASMEAECFAVMQGVTAQPGPALMRRDEETEPSVTLWGKKEEIEAARGELSQLPWILNLSFGPSRGYSPLHYIAFSPPKRKEDWEEIFKIFRHFNLTEKQPQLWKLMLRSHAKELPLPELTPKDNGEYQCTVHISQPNALVFFTWLPKELKVALQHTFDDLSDPPHVRFTFSIPKDRIPKLTKHLVSYTLNSEAAEAIRRAMLEEPLFSVYDPYAIGPGGSLIYPDAPMQAMFPTEPVLMVFPRERTVEKARDLTKRLGGDFFPNISSLGRITFPIPVTPERQRALAHRIAAELLMQEGGDAAGMEAECFAVMQGVTARPGPAVMIIDGEARPSITLWGTEEEIEAAREALGGIRWVIRRDFGPSKRFSPFHYITFSPPKREEDWEEIFKIFGHFNLTEEQLQLWKLMLRSHAKELPLPELIPKGNGEYQCIVHTSQPNALGFFTFARRHIATDVRYTFDDLPHPPHVKFTFSISEGRIPELTNHLVSYTLNSKAAEAIQHAMLVGNRVTLGTSDRLSIPFLDCRVDQATMQPLIVALRDQGVDIRDEDITLPPPPLSLWTA